MIQEFINKAIINPSDVHILRKQALLESKKIIFVDTSYTLPNTQDDAYGNFLKERIPHAVFFDIDSICDQSSELPHMLPDLQTFNTGLSSLGIQNTDIVILYAQSGIIMGPARVWWMLQGFGHKNCLILNGGLSGWKNENLPLEKHAPVALPPSQYRGIKFNKQKITHLSDIVQSIGTQEHPILDARPPLRFQGKAPEPREGLRSGHIPHSINIPAGSLIDDKGFLKSKEELLTIFKTHDVKLPAQKTIFLTCGSGITACVIGLALHHIGETNFSVYDGSWSEWGQETMKTDISTI